MVSATMSNRAGKSARSHRSAKGTSGAVCGASRSPSLPGMHMASRQQACRPEPREAVSAYQAERYAAVNYYEPASQSSIVDACYPRCIRHNAVHKHLDAVRTMLSVISDKGTEDIPTEGLVRSAVVVQLRQGQDVICGIGHLQSW